MKVLLCSLAIACLLLAACHGSTDLTCDDESPYMDAHASPPVKAPEGLDKLDPLKEVPLPKANPQQPRPKGSNCLDLPPEIEGATGS